jgi:hypothetical protein
MVSQKRDAGRYGPSYRLATFVTVGLSVATGFNVATGFSVAVALTVGVAGPLYPGSPGNLGVYPPGTGVGDAVGFIETLGTVTLMALTGVLVGCGCAA